MSTSGKQLLIEHRKNAANDASKLRLGRSDTSSFTPLLFGSSRVIVSIGAEEDPFMLQD